MRYKAETLSEDIDDGTMPTNVDRLTEAVIGRRIVSVEGRESKWSNATVITLDNGRRVTLANTDDCCAYTELQSFFLNPELVDHAILGVGTTDGFETWHVYCDLGDVMEMKVGWSCGNPFYYGYGFHISVRDVADE